MTAAARARRDGALPPGMMGNVAAIATRAPARSPLRGPRERKARPRPNHPPSPMRRCVARRQAARMGHARRPGAK